MPHISAIVVTRNNRNDIGRCIESLARSRQAVDEVIVLDHDSQDGTADYVRRVFPEARLLDFLDNPGFGEGNNRGARVATGEYLLLLNPDATVTSDCVGHLLDALDRDPRLAVAVPKVVLASDPSVLNSTGLSVNTVGYGWDRGYLEWDEGQYDRSEPILAGSGCALLIRADVFLAHGGFDAAYFLYYEDLDLCWRFSIAGRPVQYVPAAVVHHAMKVSGRPTQYDEYIDHRNRLRTLLKNLSVRAVARTGPPVLWFEVRSLLYFIWHRRWRSLRMRAHAWWWNIVRLPDTLARRREVQQRRTVPDADLAGFFVSGDGAPQLKAAFPHYRETYDHLVDHASLSTSLTMGTSDGGVLGLGWYGLESFDGVVPSRWCCAYGIAFLGAPMGCEHATLTLRCAALRPTEVVVRTDRQERGRFVVLPGTWSSIEAQVPIDTDSVRVEILVPETFVPSHINPSAHDHRTLGIAVASITLQAADHP